MLSAFLSRNVFGPCSGNLEDSCWRCRWVSFFSLRNGILIEIDLIDNENSNFRDTVVSTFTI